MALEETMTIPIHITTNDSAKDIKEKAKAIARETIGRKVNCYQVKHDETSRVVSIPLEPNYLLTVRHVIECNIEIDHGYYEVTPAAGIVVGHEKRTVDTGAATEYDEHANTGVTIRYDELDIELKRF